MTAIGASRPLRRIPAIVSFLNPQPALSLVGGNRSSCPIAAVALGSSDGEVGWQAAIHAAFGQPPNTASPIASLWRLG